MNRKDFLYREFLCVLHNSLRFNKFFTITDFAYFNPGKISTLVGEVQPFGKVKLHMGRMMQGHRAVTHC